MAKDVPIREATAADLEAVVELMVAQLREHGIETPAEEIAAGIAGVLERPQRGRILLASAGGAPPGGEPVGIAALSFLWTFEHGGRAAWLDELYVVPALRSRGIGARLLRAACEAARDAGARAVDLEVDAGHRRAANLYERAGFRRHDRERWVLPLEPRSHPSAGMAEPHAGGCACGALRYLASAPPIEVAHCHCRSCRRASGAPMVTWATFPIAALTFPSGRPRERRSSPHVVRTFCEACGSALTYREDGRPGTVDVTVATLDRPEAIVPDRHIWIAHRLPWLRLDDDLPRDAEDDPAEAASTRPPRS